MSRLTTHRRNILNLINQYGHLTIPEIQKHLIDNNEKIALSTIYRSLNLLEDDHVVRRIQSKYGFDYYELYEQEAHDHFVCVKCWKIFDIPKKKINTNFLKEEGKLVDEIVTTYYGICNDCNLDN